MARYLFALSGGVDSSTAAAHTLASNDSIVGDAVTLGLWGGERESNSCSTADSSAAKSVADNLGVSHTYIDWTDDFNTDVIGEFVEYAKQGKTTNPCITCNKTFKADRMFAWAAANGYDRVVTGHYARVVITPDGPRIGRAIDSHKDQSYVLCAFEPHQIEMMVLPLGEFTKPQVRELAREHGLDVADKPESMGLCFSPRKVLATAALGNVAIVDSTTQRSIGEVPVGLAAVGQRKGLGVSGNAEAKYVVDIRPDAVVMGSRNEMFDDKTRIVNWHWVGGSPPSTGSLAFQTSAHGASEAGRFIDDAVIWDSPHLRVAPGQIVVAYATYDIGGESVDVVAGWGEAN
jgi:tRNA-uridine 2-sulfurtransferase